MRWNSNLFSMPKKKLLFQLSLIAHSKHRARLPSSQRRRRETWNQSKVTDDRWHFPSPIDRVIYRRPRKLTLIHQWKTNRHEWKIFKKMWMNLDYSTASTTQTRCCAFAGNFNFFIHEIRLRARSLAVRLMELERVGAIKTPLGVFWSGDLINLLKFAILLKASMADVDSPTPYYL